MKYTGIIEYIVLGLVCLLIGLASGYYVGYGFGKQAGYNQCVEVIREYQADLRERGLME